MAIGSLAWVDVTEKKPTVSAAAKPDDGENFFMSVAFKQILFDEPVNALIEGNIIQQTTINKNPAIFMAGFFRSLIVGKFQAARWSWSIRPISTNLEAIIARLKGFSRNPLTPALLARVISETSTSLVQYRDFTRSASG